MEEEQQYDYRIIMGVVTRHRPYALRRCLTSAIATAGVPIRAVTGFDDDMVGFDMCPNWPWLIKLLLTPRHYYVRGKNAVYEYARQVADETGVKYFVMSNDDSEWLRPDWGKIAVNTLEHCFDDGYGIFEMLMPGHCAHYITTFRYIDEVMNGRLGDPAYTMYFSDSDMLLKAQANRQVKSVGAAKTQADSLDNKIVAHDSHAVSTHDHTAWEVQRYWWDADAAIFNERWPDRGVPTAEEEDDEDGS